MDEKNRILNSGLLEQYVLGLLSPKDVYLIEKHLENHPDLRQHVDALQQTMQRVLEENAIAPPPTLKDSILSEIDGLEQVKAIQEASTPPTPPRSTSWLSGLVLSLALLLAFGMYHFYQANQATASKLEALSAEHKSLQKNCNAAQAQLQAQYQFVRDPDTKHIPLRGTDLAPKALVIAYMNENNANVSIDVVDLPAAPQGKRYHLWADVDGKMLHMGDLEDASKDLQNMKFIARATSLNITLEDAGEVEEPTVSQLYVNGIV